MADQTLVFEDMLRMPNLRAKNYQVTEPAGSGLVCVDLSARRQEDWFFARRWANVQTGRRLLFQLLDEVESRGFKFQVTQEHAEARGTKEPWQRASENVGKLSADERRIYVELFPNEENLLSQGYDWDHQHVYTRDGPLQPDAHGRVMEERSGAVYEWVRVPEEFTWRRYPLHPKEQVVSAPNESMGG